jgi:hypothetical protein
MTRNWKEVTLEDGTVWDKEKPLEGKFVKVETDIGPNKSKMYTIKTEKEEVKVWGSTVLDDKLMGVPQGTYVKIEYEGKLKSKKGTEYHSYKVFIDEDSKPDIDAEHQRIQGTDETIDLSEVFPE